VVIDNIETIRVGISIGINH